MKVAYLFGSLNRGGTETLLLDIMDNVDKAPFSIIGVYRKEGDLSKVFKSTKVKMIKIIPSSVWLFWLYIWHLRKLFKQEKIQIIHAHQRIDTIYARIAGYGLPIKVVQTFHDLNLPSDKWVKSMSQISIKFAHLNIFVSNSQKWYYDNFFGKLTEHSNQIVIHNGINFNKLSNSPNLNLRDELKIGNDILLLGMVGNFVSVRDPFTICRFLKLLNQHHNKFIFLFIGKKDENNPDIFDNCISFCQNNGLTDKVIFMGQRSDVPDILPQLDAFLYSSDHDTFGIAVIEAIATGIPVFVNDWKVMVEITENGKFAILYKTKNENDLLEKFEDYLNNKNNTIKQAKKNALQVQEKYNIQNHIHQLYKTYKSLI